MFQVTLGCMMREEQFRDYVREAEEDRRKTRERSSRSILRIARTVALTPLAIVTLISRVISFYLHATRHSL